MPRVGWFETFGTGARQGAIAWVTLEIVDLWAGFVLGWLPADAESRVDPLDWRLAALLLALCSGAGALCGGAAALLLRRADFDRSRSDEAVRIFALFSMLLALAVHVTFVRGMRLSVAGLWALCGLLLAAAYSLPAESLWGRRLRRLANPWTASLLATGWTAIMLDWGEREPAATRLAIGTCWVAGVVALTLFIGSLRRPTSGIARGAPRAGMAVFAAMLVTLAASFAVMRQSLRPPEWVPPRAAASPSELPPVVLISLDTVRADHLSVYGYERDTTPRLQELAADAEVYTNAISAGDMTLVSHASLFTGLYARSHGAHFLRDRWTARPLADDFATLAEMLASHGYRTYGIVANSGYLAPAYGISQGFDYYDARRAHRFLGPPRELQLARSIWKMLSRFVDRECTRSSIGAPRR